MKIVISGVNLVEGGPLKVFRDAISAFSNNSNNKVVCLVNRKELFIDLSKDNVTFLEYPEIKKSWVKRVIFEYWKCKGISEIIRPDVWLSMHDISPFISCGRQFVYCHNPSPFFKATSREIKYEFNLYLFSLFYKWLYRINIGSNEAVIVQQEWIGKHLTQELGAKRYIVSRPISSPQKTGIIKNKFSGGNIKFFFPALARTFKNFEVIYNALQYLKENFSDVYHSVEVVLTINESSGRYALSLLKKFSDLERVRYIGLVEYDEIISQYEECDVVLFPSKLETWGLPISEAKEFNKPIILSDLPYAHETLGNYSSAIFFDPDDCVGLANIMKKLVLGENVFSQSSFIDNVNTIHSWSQLVEKIES
jgi:glycosyltransferase involved in cell wall biosynthesis